MRLYLRSLHDAKAHVEELTAPSAMAQVGNGLAVLCLGGEGYKFQRFTMRPRNKQSNDVGDNSHDS